MIEDDKSIALGKLFFLVMGIVIGIGIVGCDSSRSYRVVHPIEHERCRVAENGNPHILVSNDMINWHECCVHGFPPGQCKHEVEADSTGVE